MLGSASKAFFHLLAQSRILKKLATRFAMRSQTSFVHRFVPGETVEVDVQLPVLPRGRYILEFDLVSNDVCWFAINGSEVVRVAAEVLPSA